MKKVAIVVVLIILSITNANAASKATMKRYTRIYIATKYNWNNEEFKALEKLIQKESSWNAKAVNRYSGAFGLCQSLPANKMRSAGKDYKTNYRTQIKWCSQYIKRRYKTPKRAWAFWLKHHWF